MFAFCKTTLHTAIDLRIEFFFTITFIGPSMSTTIVSKVVLSSLEVPGDQNQKHKKSTF